MTVDEEKRLTRRLLSWAAAYIVGALLMFGWTVNHTECKTYEYLPGYVDCSMRDFGAIASGLLWPIVLSGRVAIAVTKWP